MLGFVLGAACLYLLIRTVRGGRWAYAHGPWAVRGWGGGCGRAVRWNGWGETHHGAWGGRPGARGMLRWLFERLETSPGQEKVVIEAAEAMRNAVQGWWGDLDRTRSDVARSIRGEVFDGAALEEAFARADGRLNTLRDVVRAQAARVHEALDARQRAELADLLASGWGRRWNL
jgi:hypothetical protein